MKRSSAPDPAVIRAALEEAGTVEKAAERLGVHRATLHRWMRELGIKVRRELVATD